VQHHGIVHASSHKGHGENSVWLDHLHVRGRRVVSIMDAPGAIAMPAISAWDPPIHCRNAAEISQDCGIFPVVSPPWRCNQADIAVALDLLIRPLDGV
jgi:hypothetical protein